MKCLCTNCNKEFDRTPSQHKRSKNHFCSRACSVSFNNSITKNKGVCCLKCQKGIPSGKTYCSRDCEKVHKNEKRISDNPGLRALKTHLELKSNKCSICELSEWNNKKLVLIMDHIDGNPYNNDLLNLRLVCPNCDSQLDTYKGRNIGKGRFERMRRYNNNESY